MRAWPPPDGDRSNPWVEPTRYRARLTLTLGQPQEQIYISRAGATV